MIIVVLGSFQWKCCLLLQRRSCPAISPSNCHCWVEIFFESCAWIISVTLISTVVQKLEFKNNFLLILWMPFHGWRDLSSGLTRERKISGKYVKMQLLNCLTFEIIILLQNLTCCILHVNSPIYPFLLSFKFMSM